MFGLIPKLDKLFILVVSSIVTIIFDYQIMDTF